MTNPVAGVSESLITANTIRAETRDQALSYSFDENSVAAKGEILGQSLGSALHKYLGAEQANYIEQKKLDAAARQGQDKAINAVDKEAERTGWKKVIFGQDEGYEVAMARSAENALRDTYMEEATTIDNYAGISPDEYKARLSEKLTEMLDKNPNDQLYRQSVTDAWTQRAEKLAMRQYEANTAYNQLTARANADRQIRQELDEIHIDFQNARSPDEIIALNSEMQRIIKGENLPSTMHPVAKRQAVNEAIFSSIAQGNIGVYNVAKQMGYTKEFTGQEQAQLDRALGQYTQDWHYDIVTKFEEAELAATNEGTNIEAAKQTWFKLDDELRALKLRSAGTKEAESILARYFSASAGKRSALDELRDRLLTQGAKVDIKAAQLQATKSALREAPLRVAGSLSVVEDNFGPVSKEVLTQAFDSNLIDDVTQLMGGSELLDSQQVVSAMLTDSNVARLVGAKNKASPVKSTIIKRAFEHVVGGYTSEQFINPDTKQATPELVSALGNLRLMATNNAKIPLEGDALVAFGLLEKGISNQKPIPQIETEINAYLENKDKQGLGEHWPTEKQDVFSKQQYIEKIVEDMGGGIPKGTSLLEHIDTYKTGLIINGGDHDAAKNYLRDFVGGKNLTYRGKTIVNGKKLDDFTGAYNFSGTLEWLQKTKDAHGDTVFNGYMRALVPADKKGDQLVYPSNLDEVGNWYIKTEEGFDGAILYLENGFRPWMISRETLSRWGQLAAEDRKIKEEKEAAMWKSREEAAMMEELARGSRGY